MVMILSVRPRVILRIPVGGVVVSPIFNVIGSETPLPAEGGLETVMLTDDPDERIRFVKTLAVKKLLSTYAVCMLVPFQRMTEPFTKLKPVTSRVT